MPSEIAGVLRFVYFVPFVVKTLCLCCYRNSHLRPKRDPPHASPLDMRTYLRISFVVGLEGPFPPAQ